LLLNQKYFITIIFNMKNILLTICFLFSWTAVMFAQTSLEGKVKEKDSGEPVLFGTVVLFKNGVYKSTVETDLDGNYFFSDIQPGTYDVELTYVGFKKSRTNGVVCKAGQNTRLNIELEADGNVLNEVVITEYKVPLIEIDNTSQGSIITSEKINRLPVKEVNSIVATAAGVSTTDGGAVSIRGSRSNETIYFIDGIRSSASVPVTEIDQLQLITGGVEAKYGDVSGGIISITTKGPSKKFSANAEYETSEGLDGRGYNQLVTAFSGPILKNKKGQPVIGYRLAGQFNKIDGGLTALGYRAAPLSVIEDLEKNPFYTVGTEKFPRAELLTADDIGPVRKIRPADQDLDFNVTGKLDFRVASGMDISVSGNHTRSKNRNTPGSWELYNWHNSPYSYGQSSRVNFSLKHRLGKQVENQSAEEKTSSSNQLLRNISYQLLAGYEKFNNRNEDFRHEDRLFNYGYSGIFPQTFERSYANLTLFTPNGQFEIPFFHTGFTRVRGDFIPNNDINPVLAKYENESNGLRRTDRDNVWTNLFNNVGQVSNNFSKSESELYTFKFSTGLDIVPGRSEKGRHSIEFGLHYEQSLNSSYSISPSGLWRAAEIIQNSQLSLSEVDTNFVVRIDTINTTIGPNQVISIPVSIYNPVQAVDKEDKFFYKIREKLGVSEKTFVNVNQMSPDQLSLDMFSSRELTDNGLLNYSGYDYLGNKTKGNTSFEDFFTARDAEGRRSHPVAPLSPIYAAGYIQDKFSYKDIIFRIGVRADYFDANTKVFKDLYAPYEIQSAKDFYTANPDKKQPASVKEDYKVYVAGPESNEVIGYRQGDQWFKPNGEVVSDGNRIFNGAVVYPKYVGEKERVLDIQDPAYKPEYSFEDYKPQLNFMPRLSFSFPISDEANFFANYDVLYQRPASNTGYTALNYFYWNTPGGTRNNPNLKPQRNVTYELGFQQKISNSSALKLSAYYRENKDLIQLRNYINIPAPIGSFDTYGNIDFGTTKGFTLAFDKRRTGNLEFNATYSLQFADGSGSNSGSSAGINGRGILRVINPLSTDERHRITATLDYRFDGGKKYDGPTVGSFKLLENTGLLLTSQAVSGQPFTRTAVAASRGGNGYLGSINGSRMPWTLALDMRLDRDFKVKFSKDDNKSSLGFNVYFRVQNLLDTRNINSVFSFTGDPENDGYLLSSFGQNRINEIKKSPKDLEIFYQAYDMYLQQVGNYFAPRRMSVGAIFNL
jgi:outer membrane receptor protein involved in Fe transport